VSRPFMLFCDLTGSDLPPVSLLHSDDHQIARSDFLGRVVTRHVGDSEALDSSTDVETVVLDFT